LKLNGTHQLLVYADDINMFGGSVYTTKKNTEALVVASKENGLEVNTDKTNYMVMSRDKNAGRSHNIKTDNSPFEFNYVGTALTDQNFIQEEFKNRLKSRNACSHSVQNLLSSIRFVIPVVFIVN